jgi:hypothetical protein
MDLIFVTGIFTGGIIPVLAAIGKGINLIVTIFKPNLYWGYWECAAVGLTCSGLLSWITYMIKSKQIKNP